jgi:hypothetical protein
MRPTPQTKEEVTHRSRIISQIQRCDELFSGYDASPTVINVYSGQTSFLDKAHEGKKVALAVLTLYAQCESILPEEFFKHFESKHRKEKAFKQPYTFINKDPIQQFEGILKVWFFYKELLNAIWSLPDFSDIKLIYKRRDIDLFDVDEEDTLFGEYG